MDLVESAEIVVWPETHYVFVEREGPFQPNAQLAWEEFHRLLPKVDSGSTGRVFFSEYQMNPPRYRAGVGLAEMPEGLPEGMRYERFGGGRYRKATLKGSYRQLPQATGRVWDGVFARGLAVRADWAIEHYANNPVDVAEADVITEILVPVE